MRKMSLEYGVNDAIVIGAGIGGLTAGALLAKAGWSVTVLEGHVDPGGCAATFRHRGSCFDAGATLVGGFQPGGPHDRIGRVLGIDWPVRPVEPAMIVWLPDGPVTRWSDPWRWQNERVARFGLGPAEAFWRDQESTADRVWSLSRAPWPPGPPAEWLDLARLARPDLIRLLPHLNRTVAAVLRRHRVDSRQVRGFVDAQLLITAQAGAAETAWLYGATALDFARSGVFAVAGGIGAIAECLAEALRRQGGTVLYKRRVTAIHPLPGDGYRVETARGETHAGRTIIANLSPSDLAGLLDEPLRAHLPTRWRSREPAWGAALAYLELDATAIPPGFVDHHQFLGDYDAPLGEGNTVFLSLAPEWDTARAPAGLRVATLSTHTRAWDWWQAPSREAYRERRAEYTERLLRAAEQALPNLRAAIRRCLPATPVTFHRFTQRATGYVGGFPQTSLFQALGPGTGLPNLYLVGDSTFPGQSTAAVTLGAERLVRRLLRRR